jgi:hypothetical protein
MNEEDETIEFTLFEAQVPERNPFVQMEVRDFKTEYKTWKKLEKEATKVAVQKGAHVALVLSDERCKVFKCSSRTEMFDEDNNNYRFVGRAQINLVEKIGETR